MKLSLFISALTFSFGLFSQWEIKHLDENNWDSRTKIDFHNDSVGYCFGDNNLLLKTIDAGENWHNLNSNLGSNITDFQIINDTTIHVINNEFLFTSTNQGVDWNSSPGLTDMQYCFWYFDTNKRVIGNGNIYLTETNGNNWDTVWSITQNGYKYGSIDDIIFTSSDTGYAIGYARNNHNNPLFESFVLKTIDAGKSWTSIQIFSSSIHAIHFINNDTGFVGKGGKIFKTLDGGNNWTESLSIQNDGNIVNSIQFISDSIGYAVGGYSYIFPYYETYFFVAQTTDGGKSWLVVDTLGIELTSIHFLNENIGFVSGYFELIMKSDGFSKQLPSNYPWHLFTASNNSYEVNSQITVYPNPSSGIVNITNKNTTQKINKIAVFDAYGKLVFQFENLLNDNRITINMSGLKSGLYFYQIQCGYQIEIKKVIKL